MDRFTLVTIGILSTFTYGCATPREKIDTESMSIYQKKVLEENQRTNEVLAKAALLSAKSLAVFVRTEQAVRQKELSSEQIRQARFQSDYIPVNMEQKIEYAWDAAPEPLIAALAANAGYELIYVNQKPPIPKTVTVSSELRMITEYFDIIQEQAKGYIKDIVPDDKYNKKVIRIYYAEF
jgi:hypothetical protein